MRRIDKRLRALVDHRIALVTQAEQIKQSMQAIPRIQQTRLEYSIVNINDLSTEERSKIIRMESKPR